MSLTKNLQAEVIFQSKLLSCVITGLDTGSMA